jgi:hypothetical protein
MKKNTFSLHFGDWKISVVSPCFRVRTRSRRTVGASPKRSVEWTNKRNRLGHGGGLPNTLW